MRNKLFLGAVTAMMLTACSQDEVTGFKQDGIGYSVAAGKQTRAADSYCNTALPESFKVWAQTTDADAAIYINGDRIVRGGGNPVTWTDNDGTRYWPQDKTLDFFAEVNGDAEFNLNGGAPTFEGFTVKDGVAEQLDLMYAVKKGQGKADGTVALNFRHALSQVCFKAKNNTKNLRVEIKGVSVGHLTNSGTFAFPTADTEYNYENHSDVEGTAELNGGTWTLPADAAYNKQYDVALDNVTLAPGTDKNLTCPGEGHVNGFDKVLTLLPQSVKAWEPTVSPYKGDGAYFLIDVVLSNVTTGSDGAPVYTTAYEGKAAIPAEIAWKQGCRYIYTFIFDEGGNGGWTDGETPEPVLTNIKYDVTVDDFIPVEEDKPMDTGTPQYKYNCVLNLHSNAENADEVKKVQLNSNEKPYSFTLASEYTPVREGYEFAGWATSATATAAEYAEGEAVSVTFDAETIDLYAVWTEAKYSFTINFDLNGGVAGDGYIANTVVSRPDGFVYSLGDKKATKEGYVFKGWGLTPDATETVTQITLSKEQTEVTVYAVWEKQTTFTLTYDGNGRGAENIPATETKKITGETAKAIFTVTSQEPTRDGWVFKGWSNKAGNDNAVVYEANDEITLNEQATSMTLYAVWEQRPSSGNYSGARY